MHLVVKHCMNLSQYRKSVSLCHALIGFYFRNILQQFFFVQVQSFQFDEVESMVRGITRRLFLLVKCSAIREANAINNGNVPLC